MNDDDLPLLTRYARERDEDAFAEIVRRHLNLVYSVALRTVRSPELAEEVAQFVFTDLARKADRLSHTTALSSWLYTVAHRAALNVLRRELRRKCREQVASEMNALETASGGWTHVAPLLDEAMHALSSTDRTAILLRYFENKSLREVGRVLGTSDDAAQKRVSRALEQLRKMLTRQGVTVSAAGLVALVSANAVQAAPAGLADLVSSGSLLVASSASVSLKATTTKILAMTTTQKTAAAVCIAAALAAPSLIQHCSTLKLRQENRTLRQQLARFSDPTGSQRQPDAVGSGPALPPPRVPIAPVSAEPSPELRRTNLIARLLRLQAQDRQPRLTPPQIDSYLQKNGRSPATLLAAFRTSGDTRLLEEALEKYPNDAEVSFTALFQGWFGSSQDGPNQDKGPSPVERRQWLDAFKQSAPENSLADYLSALDYFRSGRADKAVEELNAAAAKPQFQDYSADFVQNDEEAWLAAGYSVAEAKTAASMLLVLPHLGAMKELSQDILGLANSYRQAGDPLAAQTALQAGVGLGQRLNNSPDQSLVNELVGDAVQAIFLRAMDPASPYDGQTVQNRLDQLAAQRATISDLTKQFDALQQQVSEQDWISYKDRWRSFGEEAALRWIVAKYSSR